MASAMIYQIGNDLFRDLRAFLCAANIDPSECKITIEVPADSNRFELVTRLKDAAPPIGQNGRVSAAQAGNHSGSWQGVQYEITVKARPSS